MASPKDTIAMLLELAKERAKGVLPAADLAKQMTNEKILEGLKALGVATQAEVNELREEVAELKKKLSTHSH